VDRLDARALAVDHAPRIGLVELDVFRIGRAPDDDPAPTALLVAAPP
jgi:hypothetical protein